MLACMMLEGLRLDPCYTDHFTRFFLVVRHMSSIGFDGKLEPAFVQHILIGRVEHQPLHDGMNELEPFQHHAYMFTGICRMLDAMLRVMLGVTLHASSHKSSMSRFMPLIMLHAP